MATNKGLVLPSKTANIRGVYDQHSDEIAGARYPNYLSDDSDEEDTFVDCGEVEQPMVCRDAGNRPSRETFDHETNKEFGNPEINIKTSFDTIIVTITNKHDSAYYEIYCEETLGITRGPFTRENSEYMMKYLRKNTDYTIKVHPTFSDRQSRPLIYKTRTLFCSPPHNVAHNVKNNKVKFTWKEPLAIDKTLEISEYILEVRNYMTGKVDKFTNKTMKKLKISCDLNMKCSHQFSLCAKAGDFVGSEIHWDDIHLKHRLCKMCKSVVKEKNRTMYLLKPNEIKQREECVIEKNFGDAELFSGRTNENVILLVGETGTGKTSWINAFVNFLFGVTEDDEFRFKLIDENDEDTQTESKTQCVTVYRLAHQKGMAVNYGITLIDTPGFGDTRGIGRDKQIENEIHTLFGRRNGYLDYINAVAFVMPANASRLSPTMKYIFDSIISLFGKNLKENLILVATHGTTKPKHAIEALKEYNIKIRNSYHFENAEVLKTKYNDNAQCRKNIVWSSTMKMFKDLSGDLSKMSQKSVSQTQEVLDERERIKLHVANLRMDINDGIKVLEQFKKELNYLTERGDGPQCNTTPIISYIENKRIEDDTGQLHNNCERCQVTCHVGCQESDPVHCIVMERRNGEAACTICINKCSWHFHSLQPLRNGRIATEKLANKEDIENRYVHTGKKLTRNELCQNLKNDFESVSIRVKASISKIDQALTRLNKIALLSWPKTQVDYIDKLMIVERQQMKEGYIDRLQLLDALKQEAKHLQSIDSGKYDPFGQYRELLDEVIQTGCDATKTSTLARYFGRVKLFFARDK